MKNLMVQHLIDELLSRDDRARIVVEVVVDGSALTVDLTEDPRNVRFVDTTEPLTKDDGVVVEKPVLTIRVEA